MKFGYGARVFCVAAITMAIVWAGVVVWDTLSEKDNVCVTWDRWRTCTRMEIAVGNPPLGYATAILASEIIMIAALFIASDPWVRSGLR